MRRDKENIHNLISQLKHTLMESEGKNVYFSIVYIIAVLTLSGISFLIEKKSAVVSAFTGALFIYWLLILYITIRFKYYRVMAVVTSLSANLLMLPALYFLTGAIYNGSVLFFCPGIIGTFFIIGESYVYIIVAAELLAYVGVLIYSALNDNIIRMYVEMDNLSIESLFNFLLAAIVPLLVLLYQAGSYDAEHKSVSQSYNLIENARKNKNRFLSNMSQELRVPMNAIMGMNEIILREEQDPVIKELATHIKFSADQLLKIINSIVEYSKLDINRMQLYPRLYTFKELIGEVIDSFASQFENGKTVFIVDIDEHIPAKLYGDRGRIKEVFMYILFSVVNRNNTNRISLSIFPEKLEDEHTARMHCRVCVSGEGMSKSELEAITMSYSQQDLGFNSTFKGIGLELSICREILQGMNGDLNIESIEGVGLAISFSFDNYIIDEQDMIQIKNADTMSILVYADTITVQDEWSKRMKGISVPLRFANGPNSFKKAVDEHAFTHIFIPSGFYDILKDTIVNYGIENNIYVITGRDSVYGEFDQCKIIYTPLSVINISNALNGMWDENRFVTVMHNEEIVFPNAKVLIVDDSIVNLKVLKGILKAYEIDPDMSKNADDALKKIDEKLYDLIILDQIMPGTDGIDLLHIIQGLSNANNKTPIICATADFGQEVGRRLIAEGFTDYLAKPVQQFYLERMLRKYISKSLAEKRIPKPAVESAQAEVKEKKDDMPATDPTAIDYAKGLEMTGGSLDAYGAILNSYLKEGLRKINDIRNELASDDINLYTVDVHALKSSSASIGAQGISERFKALEFAGRESKRSFIDEHTEETLVFFEMVLNQIRMYLEKEGLLENDSADNQKAGETLEIDVGLVEEMQDALSKINLRRCEEIINELNNNNYGSDINGIVSSIKSSYDMFDYPKAKQLMQELHDKITN